MKKLLIISALILLLFTDLNAQDSFTAKSSNVHFFSEAPLENIEATNEKAQSILNVTTKKIAVIIPIVEFHFEKPLMEEHFNENYMESHKYKVASFSGIINENIDITKDGEWEVTATGKLNIHGVEQDRTLNGKLTRKGNVITLQSKFQVKLVDHKIEIPKMVIENIAEIIDVTVNIEFQPKAGK